MKPSEHDLIVEQKREEAREQLIDLYMQIAIEGSDEYGFLNVMGHEVPDPTQMEPPLGYVQSPDLMEQMRAMIRRELSAVAAASETETFDEADDFDIEDDPVDYSSPYEMYFDPSPGEPAGPAPTTAPPATVETTQPPPPPPGEPEQGA